MKELNRAAWTGPAEVVRPLASTCTGKPSAALVSSTMVAARISRPSEVATLEGREALSLAITESINEALGFKPVRDAAGKPVPNGPVQAVLFTSFIIQ